MMDANEESEIFESLGKVSRTAAAGTMQTVEMASRRHQMSQSAKERDAQDQQRHAETMQRLADRDHKQESTLASVMRNDSYQRHFWRHAGSEQIADYMTASAHLAPRHAEARSAYMHISDVMRNDYGINIEQMNRDHPTSLMDRHHALRDALDDYFNRHRMDAEADKTFGQQQTSSTSSTDGEAERSPEGQTDSDDDSHARVAAAQAGSDKADSISDVRQPSPYQRSRDSDLDKARSISAQAPAVRERTRRNFPQPSTQRAFDMNGPAARRGVAGRAVPTRDLGVSR